MHFIGPFGVLGNLLLARSPLFEADKVEAFGNQAVHIARHGAMVFHDARCDPLGYASSLEQVVIDRPHPGPVGLGSPPWCPRGGEDGVLDGKHEPAARHQQSPYRRARSRHIRDVVQRQGAVDEIEGRLRQRKLLYVSLVEHPARMGLETRMAAVQWAPSYRRATWMQAPLALLSFLGGLAAWLMGAGSGWLLAALLIGLVVPFTFIGIMPTNNRILSPGRDLDSAETRRLLERWGHLHAVRTTLSILATVLYVRLLLGT